MTMTQTSVRELATYNPRHALEGWAAGYEANGDAENAAKCRAALEMQESWRERGRAVVAALKETP